MKELDDILIETDGRVMKGYISSINKDGTATVCIPMTVKIKDIEQVPHYIDGKQHGHMFITEAKEEI